MPERHVFPFGQPLRTVVQADRVPKKVFVLGVYASAVHARWIGLDGKDCVKALAVASEPYIFWRGDGAAEIVSRIQVPAAVGKLVPADRRLNGPSGVALDDLVLNPLGVSREDTWLCDLVPHSCVNPGQREAIARAYLPLLEKYSLPRPSIPAVPKPLADGARRQAILAEIIESEAELLVLLGDEPIRWFMRHHDSRWRRLSDFTPYGNFHDANVGGRAMRVLALVHPRQAARLGPSSTSWWRVHGAWMRQRRSARELG
jgi:uracil-DNA glycosylase